MTYLHLSKDPLVNITTLYPAPKTHLRIIIHNIKLLVGHWSTGFFEPSN